MKRPRAHRLVREAHRQFDAAAAPRLAHARQLGQVTCRARCPACCSEPVFAEAREAALLADLVRAMPPDARGQIEDATRAWAVRFLASPLATEPRPKAMAYRALRLPCPLLVDGRCSVYADRPTECRAHVARGEAAGCEDDARRPAQQFLFLQDFAVAAQMPLLMSGSESDHLGLLLHRELFGEGGLSPAGVRTVPSRGGTLSVVTEESA